MEPVERLSKPFAPSIRSFVKERLIAGPSLVIVMRVLWREYQKHCEDHGFDPVPADEFAEYFEKDARLEIKDGRTGRAVNGVGFLP